MRKSATLPTIVAGGLAILLAGSAHGQALFSDNFDADHSLNWTVNNGPSDEAHDFFFDYSSVGIPSAPNSIGGTTRGMKLQANLFTAVFSGMSVSPIAQSFTGDYSVKFDWWSNFMGPLDVGAVGSTMLSTFGIETSGTFANWPGSADGTFFAITGDGASSSDYRIYSPERAVSYQLPVDPNVVDNQSPPQPRDSHANYLAGTRNSTGTLYATPFPGGKTAPALQQTNYPASQTGATSVGAAGFQWNEMEIRKEGEIVRLFANGTEIMNVDMTNYVTPNAGTNILFGHSDTSAGTNFDPTFADLQFSLYDNIVVEPLSVTPNEDADFDGDGDVDGADFLTWQRGVGINDGSAVLADGDANDDGNVNDADLTIWKDQFGTTPAAAAVPEPTTWVLSLLAAIAGLNLAGRRRLAPAIAK